MIFKKKMNISELRKTNRIIVENLPFYGLVTEILEGNIEELEGKRCGERSPIYLPMVHRKGRNPSGVQKTLNERERTEKEKIVVDLRRKKLIKVLISCRDGRLPVVASERVKSSGFSRKALFQRVSLGRAS